MDPVAILALLARLERGIEQLEAQLVALQAPPQEPDVVEGE